MLVKGAYNDELDNSCVLITKRIYAPWMRFKYVLPDVLFFSDPVFILGIGAVNGRRRYIVTSSLICWGLTQNDRRRIYNLRRVSWQKYDGCQPLFCWIFSEHWIRLPSGTKPLPEPMFTYD